MRFATPKIARGTGTRLPIEEFDAGVRSGEIEDARMDGFGSGYGEPYNPVRTVWGWRGDELVWSEIGRRQGQEDG